MSNKQDLFIKRINQNISYCKIKELDSEYPYLFKTCAKILEKIRETVISSTESKEIYLELGQFSIHKMEPVDLNFSNELCETVEIYYNQFVKNSS